MRSDDGSLRYCGIPFLLLVTTWILGISLEQLVMISCDLVMNHTLRGDALAKDIVVYRTFSGLPRWMKCIDI